MVIKRLADVAPEVDLVECTLYVVCIYQVNSGRSVTGGHQEVGRCSTRGGSC